MLGRVGFRIGDFEGIQSGGQLSRGIVDVRFRDTAKGNQGHRQHSREGRSASNLLTLYIEKLDLIWKLEGSSERKREL